MKKPIWLLDILYVLASLGCLLGRLSETPLDQQLDYSCKPLLMPILALRFYWSLPQQARKNDLLFVLALFFAWGGDVALMLGDAYFILGLGSFLLMQLLYSYLFFQRRSWSSFLGRRPIFTPLILSLAFGFYFLALPKLLEDPILPFAVALYALALGSMSILALTVYKKQAAKILGALGLGAFLFLISDLMIGLNAFVYPDFFLAGFGIMSTYTLGQWLIVWAYPKLNS